MALVRAFRIAVPLGLAALATASASAAPAAVVILREPSTDARCGTISFEAAGGKVAVKGQISGLKPGKHGFHIHSLGDLTQGCMSAGGHFNPTNAPHGGPEDGPDRRHVGDLGNILADENGVATFEIEDSLIALEGPHSIIGRSVVVHADEDDLGRGSFPDSLTTGHSGARVACGVIGMSQPRA